MLSVYTFCWDENNQNEDQKIVGNNKKKKLLGRDYKYSDTNKVSNEMSAKAYC